MNSVEALDYALWLVRARQQKLRNSITTDDESRALRERNLAIARDVIDTLTALSQHIQDTVTA